MSENHLNKLIKYTTSKGRVCPMPQQWTKLWEMLPNKERVGAGWQPSLPLILAAWYDTSDREKRNRLLSHIKYASEQGVLNQIDEYLRSLSKDEWYMEDNI